jgi:hypothetical protein
VAACSSTAPRPRPTWPGWRADPSSPLPVRASSTTLVPDTGWAWTSHGDATVVPADRASFGLPAYATSGAWATQTATELQPWARPVLDTHGKTVVAAGTLGQGKVVWEGLNLPYHLGVYRSVTEAAFLGRLLLSTVPAHAAAAQAPVTLVDAEHWRIAGVTAGGVLFKVQDAPDGRPPSTAGRFRSRRPARG